MKLIITCYRKKDHIGHGEKVVFKHDVKDYKEANDLAERYLDGDLHNTAYESCDFELQVTVTVNINEWRGIKGKNK